MGLSSTFSEPFHISSFYTYLACPRRFLFSIVQEEEGQWRPVKMVLGTAVHLAIEIVHEKLQFNRELRYYENLLRDCIDQAEFEGRDAHVPVRWRKYREEHVDSLIDKFGVMLRNYASAKMNQDCEVLYSELAVTYDIHGYQFSGRIDQIRKTKDGEIILVDFKSGRSKVVSTWNLKMNYQLGGYAMAAEQNLGMKVDSVGLYRFQDHGEYKRWTPLHRLANHSAHHEGYQEWLSSIRKYTVEEYEAFKTAEKIEKSKSGQVKPYVFTGKNRNVEYLHPGDQMGPGLYVAKITEDMLVNLAKEIQRVCAAIKRREFFRNPYSCADCRYKTPCENDLASTSAKDEVEAITGF